MTDPTDAELLKFCDEAIRYGRINPSAAAIAHALKLRLSSPAPAEGMSLADRLKAAEDELKGLIQDYGDEVTRADAAEAALKAKDAELNNLRRFVENLADQKRASELTQDEGQDADFVEAYEAIVSEARIIYASAPSPAQPSGENV